MSLSIVSWNVNGIRAVQKKNNKGEVLKEGELPVINHIIKEYNPDIICVQETKFDQAFNINDYECYNNSCKLKKGYSGVACYCKIKPTNVYYDFWGIDCNESFNNEGRVITLEYETYYIINTYVPNSKEKLERLDERCNKWEVTMRLYISNLMKHKKVILCGDLNVAPNNIDIFDQNYKRRYPGFTNEEKLAFKLMLTELDMIDAYRYKNPTVNNKFTYWSNMNKSRASNNGWRIDFFIIPNTCTDKIKQVEILDNVYGSDHCPILLEIAN